LKERRKKTSGQLINFARKYGRILETQNASELLTLSPKNRQHAMRALSNLSKYYGCYDTWKAIKQRYDLKWTVGSDIDIFMSMMDNNGSNYSAMLEWLKDTVSKIPQEYGNILLYSTLVGLRPDEACQSINLIQTALDNYLKKDWMTLEHYKYPDIFIRRTKKAYISVISQNIIELAKSCKNCGYNALRLYVTKRDMEMKMKYCRSIFATYLRRKGVESEFIDLLQGRIPKSVFARHYFRPDFEGNCKKIRKLLTSLQHDIAIS
jgi:intergrase/recombinase